MNRRMILGILGTLLCASLAHAEVPHLIRYQGQAVDSQAVPLEGPYTLTFRLYDAEKAGNEIWQEQQVDVAIEGGYFSILLGQVQDLTPVDWTIAMWLSIQVNSDPELEPRQRITSVPLAITAENLATPITTSTIQDDANALVPSGAIILWTQAACPVGYTRVTIYDGRFLVASDTAGSVGGSNTHTHSAGSYRGPSHTHPHNGGGMQCMGWNASAGGPGPCGTTNAVRGSNFLGNSTGGGGTRSVTGVSATADNRPEFMTILLCKRN